MKSLKSNITKGILFLGFLLTTHVIYAGGDAPPQMICEKMVETVIRQAFVADRGGNQTSYKIVLKAQRCRRKGQTLVLKYLFVIYDAPKVRHENDGLIQAATINFAKPNDLFNSPSARHHFTTVTSGGISMQIAGSTYPDSELTMVPDNMTGDARTVIQVFGDAFPTHDVTGPFEQ